MAIKLPRVRPVPPPVQRPIEPLEVPEEELPPVEPVEELPPVEPIEGDIFSLLRDLYPEYGIARWQSPEEAEKIVNVLVAQAQEDPDTFIQDLYERDADRAEQLLELLGAPPEQIAPITAQFVDIEATVTAVFPDLSSEELIDYVTEDWEGFVADMGGYTEEKAALLKQLGYSKGEIDAFYGQIPIQVTGGIPSFDEWVTEKGYSPLTRADELRARGVSEEFIPEMVSFDMAELRAIYEYEHDLGRWGTALGELDKIFISEPERIPEVAVVFGRTLLKLPQQVASAILTATQGQGGASVVDKDWADRFIEDAQKDLDKFMQDIAEQYPNSQLMTELASLSQNLAFSITSMGAGLAVGVPVALTPVPGARVAAYTAGTAASGFVAYQMTTYQIMQQYLELKDAEKRREVGLGLTQFEEDALKVEFHDLAVKYGLWEAIPEAISNLAFFSILTAPLTSMVGGNMATQIIAKIAGIYGEELLTETITQKGQAAIEVYAGLREKDIGWVEAFKEIAPQTFLLTTVMGGAGQAIISSKTAIQKAKKSLTEEIGVNHPQYEELAKNIEDNLEEAVKTEPKVEVAPAEVPAVPEALITEGGEIVTRAEAIAPTNPSVIEFRRLVEQAKVATTPEAQRQALIRMEALEDEVRAIAKVPKPLVAPAVPEVMEPMTLPEFESTVGKVIVETREEIAATNKWLTDQRRQREAKIPIDERLFSEEKARVEALKDRVPTLEAMGANPAEYLPRLRSEFPNILNLLIDRGRALKIIPSKPPAVEVAKPTTETIGDLKEGAFIQFNPEGPMHEIVGFERNRVRLKDGQGNIQTIPNTTQVYPMEPTIKPEVAKPPVEKLPVVTEEIIGLPPPSEPVSQGIANNTQGMSEITAKEEVRPSRKVFTKMGIWRDFYKPMSRAEALINEERLAFTKERRAINKLLSKDAERRALVWDEVNKKGSVVGLTFDEKRAVAKIREWADRWAERKNLPESKRIKDYIPHLFEEEMIREIREENGIDPVLARILDEGFAGKITDPFLKQRLGKEIGLLKDPIAAMEAYDNVALKVIYYAPMLNKINAYMSDLNIPEGSRAYLRNYARRMTGELADVDIAINKMIGEFAEAIRKAPVFGEWMYNKLTTGNPAGMAAYNLTSALYGLWLGFKATSAIRNLSQHTLIIAEVGPVHFAEAFRLGLTTEGRAYWRDSVNRRSRKRAFLPGYDSSFIAGWVQKFIDISLKLFRGADWVNTHTAFLAGVAEAKSILTEANNKLPADRKVSPERLREYIVDRGDEVFADTQYLYTKMNSMAFAQNAPGRVLSMLTTWTGNWLELMSKWIKRTPSQVYLEFERETGAKVARANWATSYKAILLYMMIVGLGYALKEKTRLKAWDYTGITSVRYLADIIGGDFPALQAPGAVADVVVGFLTGDERRLNDGLYSLKSTFTPSVMRQLDRIAAGDKDWLTFFFYVEGKNIVIKRLKEKWEKDWEEYPIFEDVAERLAFLKEHKEYAGLTDAKMRNKWREENPLIEAKMFVVGQIETLLSDKSRTEALRLIEEHNIDTELIKGYEKVFGIDTRAELDKFQKRIGRLEVLVAGEEAKYFAMGNYVSEVNALVKSVGRHKVQTEGSPLTRAILEAQDTFEAYEIIKEGDARTLWRQQYPEGEAWMYLLGKVSSFKNPKSAEILLGLMKKYNIPPQAIRAFIDKPERYDELFTQKFELEQKWFDQTTEYENFGNTEAPNYIEDKEERKLAREKFKEDNPDWVADMRRIEAIDNDASDVIIEKWVERGKTIDEFGAGSSEAKLWLLKHPETFEWAIKQELLTDDLSDENIELLQLTVDNRELFEQFSAIDAEAQEERLAFRAEHPDFDKFLIEVKGYAPHSLRETIRVFRETEEVEEKFDLLGDAVYKYGELAVKDTLTAEELARYNWDIRSFGMKKVGVITYWVGWGNEFWKIFEYMARNPDPEQLARITERVPDFDKYAKPLLQVYQSEPPDKFPTETWEGLLYIAVNSYRDGAERLIEAIEKEYAPIYRIPNQWDKIKEEIQDIPHNKPDDWPEGVDWYEDDWFLMEHITFYRAMVKAGIWERADFRTVPTRKVFDKYQTYLDLPQGKRRDDYRWQNQDLDAWLVLKFGMVPITTKRRRAELTPTEEFKEDLAKKEAEFKKGMKELEERPASVK